MSLPPMLPGESLIAYRKRVESDPYRWGRTANQADNQARQGAAQDSLRELFTVQGVMNEPQQIPAVSDRRARPARSSRTPAAVAKAALSYMIVGTLLLVLLGLLLWQLGSR